MRSIILLCAYLVAKSTTSLDKCDEVYFHGVYHEKEVLKDGVDVIGQFSVYKPNTLFYCFTENDELKLGYLNTDNKESAEISGIKMGFATAVNQVGNTIYLGGEDGIYAFNPITKSTELYGAKGTNIWSLYYWDNLYYTDFPKADLYDYNFGQPIKLKGFENNFVKFAVKDEDGIFFVNTTGLYHASNDFKNVDLYSTDDGYRFLRIDNYGNVYTGRIDSDDENEVSIEVYILNKKEKNTEKVAMLEASVTDLVFDQNNNIIYAEADKIVRLKPRTDCKTS